MVVPIPVSALPEVGVRARFEMIGRKAGQAFAVQEARQLALKRGKVRKARPATQ